MHPQNDEQVYSIKRFYAMQKPPPENDDKIWLNSQNHRKGK